MIKEIDFIKQRLKEAKELPVTHPERMAIINQWESELRRCIRLDKQTELKLASAGIS